MCAKKARPSATAVPTPWKKAKKIRCCPSVISMDCIAIISGKAYVLIRGQKAAMVGKICMDYMMVDVTDIPNVF